MDIMNFFIYMILAYIFNKIFRIALDNSSSIFKRNASRGLVIAVFSIAIISLLFYSFFIKEVGPIKRIVAGILAISCLIYLIHIVKKYLQK